MKKKILAFCLISILVLVVSACGSSPDYAYNNGGDDYYDESRGIAIEEGYGGGAAPSADMDMVEAEEFYLDDQSGVGNANTTVQTLDEGRIVIRNADMGLRVIDPVASVQEITNLAEGLGGFVVNSNVYQTTSPYTYEEVPTGYITIRVPAENFTMVVNQLEQTAIEVDYSNISGTDVTREYTDLESRLRNLEDTAAQLRLIMADADETEDVLAVFNQLTYITEQIEVIQGQLQYYSEAAALSAISVSLTMYEEEVPPVETENWNPLLVARDALQGLVNALQSFAGFLIWFVIFPLPIILVTVVFPGLIVWFIFRRVVKNRKKKVKAKTE